MRNRTPIIKTRLTVLLLIGLVLLPGLYVGQFYVDENTTGRFDPPTGQMAAVGGVNLDNLKSTIKTLENFGERSTWEKQYKAIAWIRSQFQSFGIDSWIETYESDGKTWPNLFARIEGTSNPGQLVMLLAHIDSKSDNLQKGAPGADDNGSGVAVLLECARLLKRMPLKKSVQFCIFTNEERGAKGSNAFARRAREKRQSIQAAINLDVLGYNRAITPIFWQTLLKDGSFKNKAKALFRVAQNTMLGVFVGNDVLLVAGRPANGNLVRSAAERIREETKLTVTERVSNDCG